MKLEATKQRFATEYADKAIAYLQKEGIETRKAVLPEIPFADESVDIVVAISVFEHLASLNFCIGGLCRTQVIYDPSCFPARP